MSIDSKEDSLVGEDTEVPTEIQAEEESLLEIDLIEAIQDDRDESSVTKTTYLKPANEFSDLDLKDALREAITELGWTKPTPVQGLCLPHTLAGRDVAGFAQTGTGKTGVFLITVAQAILKRRAATSDTPNSPLAVVLAPTRELAVQIHEEVEKLAVKLDLRSLAVFGGMDYDKQAQALKAGTDIVVATPGRLKDYIQKKIVSIKDTTMFVCDEVDRMFDMGFIEDVEFFLERLPENCQKLLFSATTNDKVKELAFEYLNKPEYISVNPEVITPESIEQHLILCDTPEKLRVLIGLLREHQPGRSVIFVNTKLTAEWLKHKLTGNGLEAESITGDIAQPKRISLIKKIKAGQVKILIGTDVASRGLHISDVTHVYNFDLPAEPANYVHRIGRTARAGAKGQAYSLVCEEYAENLDAIKTLVGISIPACSWFPKEYLDIVDVSGNPFQDGKVRGFKVTERKPFGKGPRDGKGPRAGSRDSRDRNDRGPRPEGKFSKDRNFDAKPGPKGRTPYKDAPHGKSTTSGRPHDPSKAKHRGPANPSTPQRDHRFESRQRHEYSESTGRGSRPYQKTHQPNQNEHFNKETSTLSGQSLQKKSVLTVLKTVFKSLFGSK
ncbi:MAG: DEAD/DEAH box helicase [Pseudomonadota bacterium]